MGRGLAADIGPDGALGVAGSMGTRDLLCTFGGAVLGLISAWCVWLGLAGFLGYPTLVMAYGVDGLTPWVITSGSAMELIFDWASAMENLGDPAVYLPAIVLVVCVASMVYGVRSLRTARA
jgi:hypothetical protein